MITLWNTLTRRREEFTPPRKTVGMYNCGPTVYNYAHIGNLRSYVFADTLKRALTYSKYKVLQVINITDVGHLVGDHDEGEDKVEIEARKEKKSAQDITTFYTNAFFDDLAALNIDTRNTKFPKATEHIPEQIALIERLEKKDFTYKTSDGIYFDTRKFKEYGKLGNIDLLHLQEGARVTINSQKKHMTDFALWKFSQPHEKRQQEWESPWGRGFPGWHLECSAMAMNYLGETVDIHTGGIDHIPVHHNNEIAQSESATGVPYVRYWLHNAFVIMDGGKKMAKSEENFIRLKTIVEKNIHPLSYRYWLLTAHYRSPVTFSWEALEGAHNAFMRLVTLWSSMPLLGKINREYLAEFKKHIYNDLDTPQAIAVIWKLIKDDTVSERDKRATITECDKMLGLDIKTVSKKLKKETVQIPPHVQALMKSREEARGNKDWKRADDLRKNIEQAGFIVKDSPHGPELEQK